METIESKVVLLNKENLIDAYNKGCSDVKNTLKNLYPDVEFEKKELPKTWYEFEKNILKESGWRYDEFHSFDNPKSGWNIAFKKFWGMNHGNYIPYKYVALRKLELLKDYYNENNPYEEDTSYYTYIGWSSMKLDMVRIGKPTRGFLKFSTKKLAEEFLENFEDLIKEAEDLI